MSTTQEVYVQLLDEGVEVFRAVQGAAVGDRLFRIESRQSDSDEVWRFPAGSIVRCETTRFADGRFGLLAVELIEAAS